MPPEPSSKLNVQRSTFDVRSVRIDKWLWGTRVYKTRSDAAEACRGSAIRHNGKIAKASAKIRIGDTIIARTKALTRTLHVTALTEKRIGAALVPDYLDDQTPDSEYEAAREKRENAKVFSHKGAGRPTKKDRRDIQQLLGE
jgi:ribosome-associated heat shock protein Hsp15